MTSTESSTSSEKSDRGLKDDEDEKMEEKDDMKSSLCPQDEAMAAIISLLQQDDNDVTFSDLQW